MKSQQRASLSPDSVCLDGRVAVVTGGGAGIGRGVAATLASFGARLAIWEKDPITVAAAGDEVDGLGLVVDVREPEEVETALAAEAFLAERERYLQISAEQSRAAETLADDRYRTGLGDFIAVLESQRLALQAEGDLIAARRQRLENRVDLYLALGGGFDRSSDTIGSQP